MGGPAVAGQTMYCYATHPCSHVALSGSEKNEFFEKKRGGNQKNPRVNASVLRLDHPA